jgi:hypothetical protein
MATTVTKKRISRKEEYELSSEIIQLQNDLLKLLLKKTGIHYDSLIDNAKRIFVANNLDLLTDSEIKKFKKIIL